MLGVIERDGLIANAARRGAEIADVVRGAASPLVTEVRGRGLLIGIGTTDGAAPAIGAAALEAGLIVNEINPSAVRLAPPLVVGDEEVAAFHRTAGAEGLPSIRIGRTLRIPKRALIEWIEAQLGGPTAA